MVEGHPSERTLQLVAVHHLVIRIVGRGDPLGEDPDLDLAQPVPLGLGIAGVYP